MFRVIQKLHRRATAQLGILALVAALCASAAAPARAGNDLEKLAIGAGVIAIILGAAHAQSREREKAQHRHIHRPQPTRHRHTLPQRCKIEIRSQHRTRHAYRGRCLQRVGYAHLPRACVIAQARGPIYGARCLSRHGYPVR